ncbi:MAG TPA: hypothetical protein VLV83_21085 [Acidobacteriota bacterium]|nr:hypothetical protein [Acidobacteriota bacterium]
MMRRYWLLIWLFFLTFMPIAAQEQAEVLALSQNLLDNAFTSGLHVLDPQSGEAVLIGDIGLDCRGLQSEGQGELYSICASQNVYYLTRIDRQTAQPETLLPLLPVTEETEENFLKLNGIRDFVLTMDRIGVMTDHIINLPTLPPGGSDFDVYERNSGNLLVRGGAAASRLADSSPEGVAEAVFRFGGNSHLGHVDLRTAEGETEVELDGNFILRDYVRLPESGELLAIAVAPPESQAPFLATIDDATGEVTPLASVPSDLIYLTVASSGEIPPVTPPSQPDRILPILLSGRVEGGIFSSHISLLNAVGTAEQEVVMDFFDASGEPVDAATIACPGQGEALSQPLASSNSRFLDLPGLAVPASGWARLRAEAAVKVSTEVLLAVGASPGCGAPATTLPSGRIQTTVQVPAVVPATQWSAQGTIAPNRESAFSLVNPDLAENVLVTVTAFDAAGEIFDINEIELLPGQRISNLLFELLIRGKVFIQPPQRPDNFQGSIAITAAHPIAVGGLTVLLPEGKWSNLPVEPVSEQP